MNSNMILGAVAALTFIGAAAADDTATVEFCMLRRTLRRSTFS